MNSETRPSDSEIQDLRGVQRSIFLVGFMACGKSTVGRALAATLSLPFVDLDQVIEARIGCTIGEFLARVGEERFREIETECLRECVGSAPRVVALGGGAFTRAINREIVAAGGVSVWLDAPFEVCWRRLTGDATVRPLAPNEEVAQERYEARRALYGLAEIRVAVGEHQSPADIARIILQSL